MIWLTANPRAHVYSFDLNRWPITEVMANKVKERFPGRFNITFGDSTKTLPEFHRQHPEVKCDFISIDGGHTAPVSRADLESFHPMSSFKNLLYYDNHPDHYKIGGPWESFKRRGKITEYFRCRHTPGARGLKYGFTFGQFIH